MLDRVSFRFDAGEKIALVGENGAGKTTLVKLLARLYDPTEGRILLDGNDLRDYDVDSLRGEIGVIFQDYMRYDMIARENIGVGRIHEMHNEKRIVGSAEKSLAAAVIGSLTNGYDQMLGRRFEGGVDLSTGQWQKLALARAYMRDAQILILDEPTASLDARAEFEVYQRFVELTTGQNGSPYLAPLLDRSDGRPHHRVGQRTNLGARFARTSRRAPREVLGTIRVTGRRLPLASTAARPGFQSKPILSGPFCV